jgi:hypothetical protein
VIFECPKCNTTHSKPERDIGSGTVVRCRRCSHEFRVSPEGVSELSAAGAATAEPIAPPSPGLGELPADISEFDDRSSAPKKVPVRNKAVVSEFHQARTEIMALPPGTAQPAPAGGAPPEGEESGFALQTVQASSDFIKENLAAMQEAEPTVPTEGAAAAPITGPAGSAVDGTMPTMPAPAAAPGAGEEAVDQPTAITTPAALLSPAGRRPSGAQPHEETGRSEREAEDESHPELSVPDTFGRLEKSVPAPRPSRPSGRLAADGELDRRLSGEQRPGRPSRPVRRGFPPFPRRAIEDWARTAWAVLKGQSLVVRILAGAAAGLTLLLFILLLVVILKPADRAAWVEADAVLWSGPGEDPPYGRIGELGRGEEVLLLEEGNHGEWVLVRDGLGRAGFLPAEIVTRYRPTVQAGVPFSGCLQSPLEEDNGDCRDRAEGQLEACLETCLLSGEEGTCNGHCQEQFTECMHVCNAGEAALAEVAQPEPTLDPVEDSGGVDSDKTAPKKPPPKKVVVQPKKTKKKKK